MASSTTASNASAGLRKRRSEPSFGPPEFIECEQRSEEWYRLRLGIPTSSCFDCIVRDGDAKTRASYMRRLAGEILTGEPAETYTNSSMQRGIEMEDEARTNYERMKLVTVDRVGFVRRRLPSGRFVGSSPDGLVGKRKGIEIKTLRPELLIALLERGAAIPPEHRWQVHGTMWVAELDEIDLVLFYRGMPVMPTFTVMRNEDVIREISNAVEIFDHELHQLVKRIRAMG